MLISDHKYIAFFAYTEIYTLFFGKNIFCLNNLPAFGCLKVLFLSVLFLVVVELNMLPIIHNNITCLIIYIKT